MSNIVSKKELKKALKKANEEARKRKEGETIYETELAKGISGAVVPYKKDDKLTFVLKNPPGIQGDIGIQGDTGPEGIMGREGPRGFKGEKGNRGLQGVTGIKGDKGEHGERGLTGLTGNEGKQGGKGEEGDRGNKGDEGLRGFKGDRGEQGLSIRGETGQIGFKGEEGKQGDKGEIGLSGEAGKKPKHRWLEKTKLQFETSTGSWGPLVELKGPPGEAGTGGGGVMHPAIFTGPKAHKRTADPTVNDDEYKIGDSWINLTSDVSWILVDDTKGAAVWISTTTTTGDKITVLSSTETLDEFLIDVTPNGILDAITVSDVGGLNITWSAGEIYVNGSVIETDSGSGTCDNNDLSYLYGTIAGDSTLILSTSAPTGEYALVARIYTYNNDIGYTLTEPVVSHAIEVTHNSLDDLHAELVNAGLLVEIDADGTNANDFHVSAGSYYLHAHDKITISSTLYSSGVAHDRTDLRRYYHSSSSWTTEQANGIDFAYWDDGTNKDTTAAGKWYTAWVFVEGAGTLEYVYPQVEHSTQQDALDEVLVYPPGHQGYVIPLARLIFKHGESAFSDSKAYFDDIRPFHGAEFAVGKAQSLWYKIIGDTGSTVADTSLDELTIAGGTGVDTAVSTDTLTITLDLNELGIETGIAAGDFLAMVDITDDGSQKITFANLEAALTHDSLVSGTIASHDTTATGANLTTLTDNSDADALHVHSGASLNDDVFLKNDASDTTSGTLTATGGFISGASIVSDTDITDDLGTGDVRWKDAWVETLSAGLTATDTLKLRGRDVDGAAYVDILTITSANDVTADLNALVTIGGNAILDDTSTASALTSLGTLTSLNVSGNIATQNYMELTEIAAPGADPADTKSWLYTKASGAVQKLYFEQQDGTVTDLLAAGAGGQDLATDTLWAAQGDLVYGTGDDGAAILSFATDGDVLRLNATVPYWDTPGIADTNPVVIDGVANDLEFAIFNAAGIEGLTDAEVLARLTGDAAAAFSWGGQALTSVGAIGCDAITSTAGIITGANIESDTDDTDDLGTTSKRWGNLHLGHDVKLDSSPDADHETSGITCAYVANENQAFGDVCFIFSDAGTSKMKLAKGDVIATSYVVGMCADATISADATGDYLLLGIARHDAWNWTIGAPVFLTITGTTTNTLSAAAPTAVNNAVVIVGIALTADTMIFNPSQQAIVEHTG